jgi:hypothetical protein
VHERLSIRWHGAARNLRVLLIAEGPEAGASPATFFLKESSRAFWPLSDALAICSLTESSAEGKYLITFRREASVSTKQCDGSVAMIETAEGRDSLPTIDSRMAASPQ